MDKYEPTKDRPLREGLTQQYIRIINSLLYENNELHEEIKLAKGIIRSRLNQIKYKNIITREAIGALQRGDVAGALIMLSEAFPANAPHLTAIYIDEAKEGPLD
jgi:hypothetical protein